MHDVFDRRADFHNTPQHCPFANTARNIPTQTKIPTFEVFPPDPIYKSEAHEGEEDDTHSPHEYTAKAHLLSSTDQYFRCLGRAVESMVDAIYSSTQWFRWFSDDTSRDGKL